VQEQWMNMKGPAMQDTQLMLPQICECNGCLIMVEVVSEHFLMTRVSIWVMQQLDSQWSMLTSMPQKILEDVISISGTCILHSWHSLWKIALRFVVFDEK